MAYFLCIPLSFILWIFRFHSVLFLTVHCVFPPNILVPLSSGLTCCFSLYFHIRLFTLLSSLLTVSSEYANISLKSKIFIFSPCILLRCFFPTLNCVIQTLRFSTDLNDLFLYLSVRPTTTCKKHSKVFYFHHPFNSQLHYN